MTIFDPRVWLALVIWTVLVFAGGNWHGSTEATKDAQIAERGRTADALAAQKAEDDRTLATEQRLRKMDHDALEAHIQEKENALVQKDRFIADLRRDNVRLRFPIRPHGQAAPDAGGPAAAGTGQEGYAELSSDSAEELVNLLARGDEGIRKHGEVVDRYERLRLTCMGLPVPPTAPSAQPTGESP